MYYYKVGSQTHYLHHRQEVCSIDVTSSGLVASGEKGPSPSIHIWDIKQLETKTVLSRMHDSDIYIVKFINDDQYLASCSLRLNPSVVIYNVKDFSVLFSCYLEEFVRGLARPTLIVSEVLPSDELKRYQQHFLLYSRSTLYLFRHRQVGQEQEAYFKLLECSARRQGDNPTSLAEITKVLCLVVNPENSRNRLFSRSKILRIIVGHEDGKASLWHWLPEDKIEFQKVLASFAARVTEILPTGQGVAFCTQDLSIQLWDYDLKNRLKQLNINTMGILINSRLKNMLCTADDRLFFLTNDGEIYYFDLVLSSEWRKSQFVFRYSLKCLSEVFSLMGRMQCLDIIERVGFCLLISRERGLLWLQEKDLMSI